MNDSSKKGSKQQDSMTLNVPVPDGATTGGTYTVSVTLTWEPSPLSVKTTRRSPSRDGSLSWTESDTRMVEDLVRSSTRKKGKRKPTSSTRRSHSGCWCNSSDGRDTDEVHR